MDHVYICTGSGKSGGRRPGARFADNTTMESTRYEVEYHGTEQVKYDRITGQTMPVNRQVLYRGILQYRNFFRGHRIPDSFEM